jgi:AraC family transcriptional regulator
MPDITLISKAVDFIEDNLKEAIAVADMADAVAYSLYHFCRMFNQATHHTPYDYLMRRRLSQAAQALLQTDEKIIEIAFDYQFSSPETFSRAFKRVFGMQPSQLRKQGNVDPRRLMPRLTFAHIKHISKGAYLTPVLEEKDAFQVAGVMTLVRENQTIISELWDLLAQELGRHGESISPRDYYGITYYPEDWENRGVLYMAAIEAQGMDIVDSALVVKTIPALKYARFIHKGATKDMPLTLDYIFHTWLPKSGYSPSSSLVVEHFGQDFQGADGEEFERHIYVPIR